MPLSSSRCPSRQVLEPNPPGLRNVNWLRRLVRARTDSSLRVKRRIMITSGRNTVLSRKPNRQPRSLRGALALTLVPGCGQERTEQRSRSSTRRAKCWLGLPSALSSRQARGVLGLPRSCGGPELGGPPRGSPPSPRHKPAHHDAQHRT
eukprot:747992-Rhodomonas_salina.3